MPNHNSGTPRPIGLKFVLRNSLKPRECSESGLKLKIEFWETPGKAGFQSQHAKY